MHMLFVGGMCHGETREVAADLDSVEVEALPADGGGRELYQKHRWDKVDAAHGFDALFINALVNPSEYDTKIADALNIASAKV